MGGEWGDDTQRRVWGKSKAKEKSNNIEGVSKSEKSVESNWVRKCSYNGIYMPPSNSKAKEGSSNIEEISKFEDEQSA